MQRDGAALLYACEEKLVRNQPFATENQPRSRSSFGERSWQDPYRQFYTGRKYFKSSPTLLKCGWTKL